MRCECAVLYKEEKSSFQKRLWYSNTGGAGPPALTRSRTYMFDFGLSQCATSGCAAVAGEEKSRGRGSDILEIQLRLGDVVLAAVRDRRGPGRAIVQLRREALVVENHHQRVAAPKMREPARLNMLLKHLEIVFSAAYAI